MTPIRRFFPPLLVAPRLFLAVAGVVAYGLLISGLTRRFDIPLEDLGEAVTVLNGIVLGVLLVFRNNAAYDRWQEGRQLWGQLINDVRNLCILSRSLADPEPDDSRELGRDLVGFAHGLRLHLRGGAPLRSVPGFEDETRDPPHIPAFLARRVHDHLARWRTAGRIDSIGLQNLYLVSRGLMDICGACERIRNTPLAYSYRALLRHGTVIYALTAPIYAVTAFGVWGLPMLALFFYFLIGVEISAQDIEEPFGLDADDLALDDYCRTIEASVAELLLSEGDEPDARTAAERSRLPYSPSHPPEPMRAGAS